MRQLPLSAVLCLAACGGGPPGHDGDPDGAVDAPIDGAGLDAPAAVTCATPGLIFCEDFEAVPLGPAASARWTTETAAGSLTVDAVHARGARALHVHTDGNGRARVQVANLAPPDNHLFGRAYAWVAAFPSAPDYAHFTMVEAAGTGAGVLRPLGGQYAPGDPAGAFWGVGSDGGPTGDWTNWRRTVPAEAGRWLCLAFELDGRSDTVTVAIDGVPRPELTVTRTDHGGNPVDLVFPTLERVWFGWWLYQPGPTPAAFDLWLDDLVLAPGPIGC
ncbi:MAG: hypothetical protein R3B06_03270 [Kofleriaceae bacterium]